MYQLVTSLIYSKFFKKVFWFQFSTIIKKLFVKKNGNICGQQLVHFPYLEGILNHLWWNFLLMLSSRSDSTDYLPGSLIIWNYSAAPEVALGIIYRFKIVRLILSKQNWMKPGDELSTISKRNSLGGILH